MVHFLISDDTDAETYAKNTFSKLPNTTVSEARLSNGLSIVYNDRRVSYTKLSDAEVWGFGTFFNDNGFHTNALESSKNLNDILDLLLHRLRGHYVFVVNSKSGVRIIPDKTGLVNVFYSDNGQRYVSTDPTMVSICASNTTLSVQEVKEFILNESTVGNRTLFTGTKRLGLGQEVKLTNGKLSTSSIHTYSVEDLSFEEHMGRIADYFERINTFGGAIATDISAGFDTRTIASIGHVTIDDLAGNTNPNPNDGGVDETLSPKIADRLSLPLKYIDIGESDGGDSRDLIHGLVQGRDIKRSFRWPKKMDKKYDYFDLILGGYGGETLRAKYNHHSIPAYYSAKQAKELFPNMPYKSQLLSKISAYPDIDTTDQRMNLVYTIDRMRIWGGSSVTMSLIYGDVLHPFMDWHLINPVFSLPPSQLKNGRYQQRIINHFAPQLSDIPINATSKIDYQYQTMKKKLKEVIKRNEQATAIARKVISFAGSDKDRQYDLVANSDGITHVDDPPLSSINIDMDTLKSSGDIKTVSRAHSISAFHNYVKKESIRSEDW